MDRINKKHLDREQFQELLHVLECYEPDHPLTEWVRRAFCVNDGDSTIHVCSLAGLGILQWTHDVLKMIKKIENLPQNSTRRYFEC